MDPKAAVDESGDCGLIPNIPSLVLFFLLCMSLTRSKPKTSLLRLIKDSPWLPFGRPLVPLVVGVLVDEAGEFSWLLDILTVEDEETEKCPSKQVYRQWLNCIPFSSSSIEGA